MPMGDWKNECCIAIKNILKNLDECLLNWLKYNFFDQRILLNRYMVKIESKFIEKAMNAIADPCRLSILQEISRKGEICCGDVQGLTGLSQPTCSHHIRLLSDSELIQCRKDGRNHYFTLNKNNFKKVSSFLEKFHEV
jgi:ArsR family transcriptional regulator, arsenate/arsenite/antimonite-responsive transcriptional repressor